MGIVQEFKKFAIKGNVLDMAVGIVVGVAFGKIVSSFVGDVITPPLGVLLGGVDFSNLMLTIKDAVPAIGDKAAIPAVTISYGKFIQTIFDFTIISFAVFLLVKTVNFIKAKEEVPPVAPPPPPPSAQEVLLTEIRDLLKNKN